MTNPIDPKRLDHVKNKVEWWYGDRRELVRLILEADDQWRRDHPQCVRISYEWPDGVGWTINHSMQQAPAPHDAAKEKTMTPTEEQIVRKDTDYDRHLTDAAKQVSPTGITPSANPTSGGKVEQDAAGEEREPELNGTRFNGDHYILSNGDEIAEYTPVSLLREIADHAEWRARQRLQDKREAIPDVTCEMMDAAEEAARGTVIEYAARSSLLKCVIAALKAKP